MILNTFKGRRSLQDEIRDIYKARQLPVSGSGKGKPLL